MCMLNIVIDILFYFYQCINLENIQFAKVRYIIISNF